MPRLDYRLAQVTAADARLAADIATRVHPDEPEDPLVVEHAWSHPVPAYSRERFFVLEAGRVVGTARHLYPEEIKPDSHARLLAALIPEACSSARLAEVYDYLEARQVPTGIRLLATTTYENEDQQAAALLSRGWERDRLSKAWNLDLVRHRERLQAVVAESRRHLAELGVRCVTLAADTEPDRYEKLYRVAAAAELDIPTTLPIRRGTFEEFMDQLKSPDLHEDRFWVARRGDEYLGLSFLKFPPERGNVWTGFTAVAREHRGKGVAKGVKMETLAQAIAMGIPRVRTDNDEENAPMLHINESLGYEPIPAFQHWLKRL